MLKNPVLMRVYRASLTATAHATVVPAHVEMMGLIGMGNNPMVGATVACAVAVSEALK